MAEKIIRDPVHDVIAFRLDRPVDALLFALINAREFQRLRRIRQLGMASLAYPGADHSRYSHSLGVMQTARRILDHLAGSFYIAEDDRAVALSAALLHDLGHGPFSHVFERVSGTHHERVTHEVILNPDSEVHQALANFERTLPQRVVAVMRCEPRRTYVCDLLSSQLDADRLDYLLRDNLMTGSQYGGYDLEWLIHALTIDESADRLVVNWKGVSAVEAYLQSRYHMYRNVYFHKVVRAGEGMVKLALQRAKRLAVQDRLEWPTRETNVYKALMGQRLAMEAFHDLDDVSILHCFKLWSDSHDATLAGICRGLLFRRLYKTIDLSRVDGDELVKAMVTAVEAAIVQEGGEAGYDAFFDELSDAPYETYSPDHGDVSSEILIADPDGQLREFAGISALPHALNRQVMFRRLHVAPEWADLARKTVEALR